MTSVPQNARSVSAVRGFLEMLAVERGAANHTIDAYRRDLSLYSSHLDSLELTIETAETEDIRAFIRAMSDDGMSAGTVARRLSAIRQLHRFLFLEQYRDDDPSLGIDSPKKSKTLPRVLSESEMTALFDAVAKIGGQDGARLSALLELLYATGLRTSELVSLRFSALDRERQFLTVRGKGGKERVVPVGSAARRALMEWLAQRDDTDNDFLFPSRGAKGHLTRQRLDQLLRQLAPQAGIDPGKLSAHVLRHAFATHLLAHGADLRAVQSMLGHASIATTQIYTHLEVQQLTNIVNQHHPLARVGNPQ